MTLPGLLGVDDRLGRRALGAALDDARTSTAAVDLTVDGGRLLARSGPGPKLQAAERRDVVAVEVDDVDEESRTGWSVVVVAGRARRLHNVEAARLSEDVLPEVWPAGRGRR